jgi:KaiC/GvpD/RAD55 family RecA-like ATPase
MADNLIQLGMSGEEVTRRTVRVVKTRGSAHDLAVREIVLGPHGMGFP